MNTTSSKSSTKETPAPKAASIRAAQNYGGALSGLDKAKGAAGRAMLAALVELAYTGDRLPMEAFAAAYPGASDDTLAVQASYVNVLVGLGAQLGTKEGLTATLAAAMTPPKDADKRWKARTALLDAARALKRAVADAGGKAVPKAAQAKAVKAAQAKRSNAGGGTPPAATFEASAAVQSLHALAALMANPASSDPRVAKALEHVNKAADVLAALVPTAE
jgi:hypothetical protein